MRVLNWAISAPVLAAEISDHAFGAARGKGALRSASTGLRFLSHARSKLKRTAGGRSGLGRVRRCPMIAVSDVSASRSRVMPAYPDVTGVRLSVVVIRRWSDGLEDWEASSSRKKAAGRVLLPSPGDYELSAAVDVDTAPPEAIEGVARLFAIRDVLRPGQLSDIGEQQSLTGAFFKSGAAECLRPLRLNLA